MSPSPFERKGAVALIRLNNPPVNALSHALRSHIVAGIDAAHLDSAIEAIVLIGTDKAFSGGADISEFGSRAASAEPMLPSVITVMELATKPIIAAISGACMGGGLELALGAHFRVAKPDAQSAFPEVKLGLLPGAGGTQRLPRLIGLEYAMNLIVSGQAMPAGLFGMTPLFDQMVDGDLEAGALAFAEDVIAKKTPLKRVRDLKVKHADVDAFSAFAANMVKGVAGPFPAPFKCIEAVKATTSLSFEDGIALERKLFVELMMTAESKSLRHAFMGERAASKIADIDASIQSREIKRVGVIGAGTMGGWITMNFLNASIPVTLLEMKPENLDRGVGIIRKNYEGQLAKGKLKADKLEARMALITPTLSYDDLAECDLIIEAVFEDMDVKKSVFETLDKVAKPGAILASNTSTLDVNAIAEFTKRPEDVVGLHFFSPANIMKLLEVVRGAKTAKDVMATVMGLAKTIRKTAVVSGVCDGFIGNRMIAKYGQMAEDLVDEGASPQQVDKVLEKFGMIMGPFRMADLAGNDISWAIRKRRRAQFPNAPEANKPAFADKLCEMGRFGQKSGKGWYLYQDGKRDAILDPEVDTMINDFRAKHGYVARPISDQEIIDRCILALVNEGARILEEGIAARASDIDMVYLTGYGFPLFRGGPMNYADERGLYEVSRVMMDLHRRTGNDFWKPAALIEKRLSEGKGLTA